MNSLESIHLSALFARHAKFDLDTDAGKRAAKDLQAVGLMTAERELTALGNGLVEKIIRDTNAALRTMTT